MDKQAMSLGVNFGCTNHKRKSSHARRQRIHAHEMAVHKSRVLKDKQNGAITYDAWLLVGVLLIWATSAICGYFGIY